MYIVCKCTLLLLLAFNLHLFDCFNLNSPTVLLPWSSNSSGAVSHFIKVIPEDQCFTWKQKRAGIVSITEGLYDKNSVPCINRLKIRPIQPSLSRESSTVFITSVSQDVSLRCDIIVDSISRIEIVTRTRELSVGETFEKIELLAYDSKGNVFTSLLGLKFNWKMEVTGVSPTDNADGIIRISKFESTSYTTHREILDLEKQGLRGSSILLHPINTGEIKLTVEYPDIAYQNVLSDEITILVRDEVILESTEELHVLKGSIIVIQANRLVHRRYYKIDLPSSQHTFQVSNNSVVNLRDGSLRAVGIGRTSVFVIDTFIPSHLEVQFPEAIVNVYNPDYLEIDAISDVNNGILEESKNYDFRISLLARGKILSLWKIQLKSKISLDSEIVSQSLHSDGKHFTIGAKAEGFVKVSVTVFGYYNDEKTLFSLDKPLHGSIRLRVVKPLSISPDSTIYLPERSNFSNKIQLIEYTVYGGTGAYEHVYENGLKYIQVVSMMELSVRCLLGTYYITFRDAKSPFLNVTLTVHVYPISKVQFNNENYETFTKTAVIMKIDVYVQQRSGQQNFKVLDYGTLPFKFTSSSNVELSNKALSNSVSFSSNNAGQYSVSASLGQMKNIQTSYVTVYHPVQLQSAECDYLGALPNTIVSLKLIGGPSKHTYGDGFFSHLSSADGKLSPIMKVYPSKSFPTEHRNEFLFECLSIGTVELIAVFGNNASKGLPDPIVINFSIGQFQCLSEKDIAHVDVTFVKPAITNGCTNLHLTLPARSELALDLYRSDKSLALCFLPPFTVNLTGISILHNKESNFPITSTTNSRIYEFKSSEMLQGVYKLNLNFQLEKSKTRRVFKVAFTVNFITYPYMEIDSLTLYAHKGDTFVVKIFGGSDRIEFGMSQSGVVVPSLLRRDSGSASVDSTFKKQNAGNPSSNQKENVDHPSSNQKENVDHPSSNQKENVDHPSSNQKENVDHPSSNQKENVDHPSSNQKVIVDHPNSYNQQNHPNSNNNFPSFNKETTLLSILPSGVGSTKITLRDLCLDSRASTSALEVTVVSATEMKVHYSDLIMVGSSGKVELEFFTKNNDIIKADKFKFLEIEVDKSSSNFVKTFDLKVDQVKNRLILEVEAIESGVTEIIFSLRASNLESAIVKVINIESFLRVSVYPSVINALPMMKFPLHITGGPNKLKKSRYTLDFKDGTNKSIQEFTDQLLITDKIGTMKILIESVSMNWEDVYSQTKLVVNCAPLNGINLHSSQDVVLLGNTIPFHVSFNNMHGVISDGILPKELNFEWKSVSTGVILMTYWNRNLATGRYRDDYILAKFTHSGRCSISVKLSNTERSKKYGTTELTASTSLDVTEPFSLTAKFLSEKWTFMPVVFRSSGLNLPLNGAFTDIHPTQFLADVKETQIINWKIVHSGKDSAVLFSCEGSVITSDGLQCNAMNPVRAESKSLSGSTTLVAFWDFQSLAVVVNTNSVNQLFVWLLNPVPLKAVNGVLSLPVSYTAEFLVVSLDYLGNPFSAIIPSDYTIEVFNGELVEITNYLAVNATFTMETKKYGSGMLKISHPHLKSFNIRFAVIHGLTLSDDSVSDSSLDSLNKVTLGGVAIISSIFARSNLLNWDIGDNKICRVLYSNEKFAVVMGLSVGSTTLNAMEGSSRIGGNILEVYDSEELKFIQKDVNIISNYINSKVCLYIIVNETWNHPSIDQHYETKVPDYPVKCTLKTSADANYNKKKWIEQHFVINKYFDTASMQFKCCVEASPSFVFNTYYRSEDFGHPNYDVLSLDISLGSFSDSSMFTIVDSFTILTDYSDLSTNMYVGNTEDPAIIDFTGPPLKLHVLEDEASFMVRSDPRHLRKLEVYTDDSYCIEHTKSSIDKSKKWFTVSLAVNEKCQVEKYKTVSIYVKSDLTKQHVRVKVMILEGRKPLVGETSNIFNQVLALCALVFVAILIVAVVFLLTMSKPKNPPVRKQTSSPFRPNGTHISLSNSGFDINDSIGNKSYGLDHSQMIYPDASCLSRSFGKNISNR